MSFIWRDATGWECDDCGKAFQSVDEAESHEDQCEGYEWLCTCGKPFHEGPCVGCCQEAAA